MTTCSVYRYRGKLRHSQKRLEEAHELFSKALHIFRNENDEQRESALIEILTKLELEMDRVKWVKEKIAELSTKDNREEDAVRRAFEKFDVDGSKAMDLDEFSNLALKLGTYPPLSMEEREEALLQIDNSLDGELSFDEFWTWWIQDKLDAMLKGEEEEES